MPRRLRIGYPRDVRMWGEGSSYSVSGQDAALAKGYPPLVAAQGSYTLSGQDVVLSHGGAGGSNTLTWPSISGATKYHVGWSLTSKSGGDPYDPVLYPQPNIIDVGAATSWVNTTGQTVYAAPRGVAEVSGTVDLIGPWQLAEEEQLTT